MAASFMRFARLRVDAPVLQQGSVQPERLEASDNRAEFEQVADAALAKGIIPFGAGKTARTWKGVKRMADDRVLQQTLPVPTTSAGAQR